MKELSLNILDVTENSVKAEATLVTIEIYESEQSLKISIIDDGYGMTEEILKGVENPFYTTRTTRKVGLGIPLLKMAAEMTDGTFKITSKSKEQFPDSHGTVVTAVFNKNHLDFTPLGDTVSTVTTLIQGHPETDFLFKHSFQDNEVLLDTRQMREMLGEVPLNSYEVIKWAEEYMREQYEGLYKI
ncbi:MAG: sensor histidine kinase [Ruminococcaceae bacterium]|nr:sensor histidine kinase [Oscillospiraceae bacterium]